MVRGGLLLVALLSTARGKRRRKLGDHPTPDEKDPGLLQRLRAGEGKPTTECEACVHLAAEAAAYARVCVRARLQGDEPPNATTFAQRLEAQLPSGNFHPDNLAAALQTLALLGRLPGPAVLNQITDVPVPARFERRLDAQQGKQVLLDVAHNPGGATRLASRLQQLRALEPHTGRIIAVLAVMADKDLESMTIALQSEVDIWYIAQVEEARCMPAREAAQRVEALVTNAEIQHFPTVTEAYDMALHRAHQNDLILVTGSFYTVAEIRHASAPQANPE